MACVQCLSETECTLVAGKPFCQDNSCVGCLTHDDCPDSGAAQCDPATSTCIACSDSTHCTEDGARVCAQGTCVECGAGEEDACGPNVCDIDSGTCTDLPQGETGLCQPCISDRQCSAGRVCVPMTFSSEAGPVHVGNFCLWRLDATEGGAPNGDCLTTRPYVAQRDEVNTLSGQTLSVCSLRTTTCEALNHFRMKSCMTPFESDDECGVPDLDDGLCRVRDVDGNQCTIPCGSDDDCETGFACSVGESPRYCSFGT